MPRVIDEIDYGGSEHGRNFFSEYVGARILIVGDGPMTCDDVIFVAMSEVRGQGGVGPL